MNNLLFLCQLIRLGKVRSIEKNFFLFILCHSWSHKINVFEWLKDSVLENMFVHNKIITVKLALTSNLK